MGASAAPGVKGGGLIDCLISAETGGELARSDHRVRDIQVGFFTITGAPGFRPYGRLCGQGHVERGFGSIAHRLHRDIVGQLHEPQTAGFFIASENAQIGDD